LLTVKITISRSLLFLFPVGIKKEHGRLFGQFEVTRNGVICPFLGHPIFSFFSIGNQYLPNESEIYSSPIEKEVATEGEGENLQKTSEDEGKSIQSRQIQRVPYVLLRAKLDIKTLTTAVDPARFGDHLFFVCGITISFSNGCSCFIVEFL
jgi:hypothetical protein